ncbi:hypothetical protein CYMTET_47093 [Cymbomonas tetramitiformis]|uniref:Uncharacterized protein n=1 Tax=Cymbomonas tetramitiformis TaxID=36881 RepID=A0AAE0BUZ1_9CHLO|nr:hypothetical protein CYMTET_47093 [Cymbomonas tetramitiformis]
MTERSSDDRREIRRASSEEYRASTSDDESLSGSSEGNSCADEVSDGYDTQVSEDSENSGYFYESEGFSCEEVCEELAYDAVSADTLRPLYPGARCTLLQALLQLGNLVSKGAVPLEAVNDFCKFEHEVKLPEGNIFPQSLETALDSWHSDAEFRQLYTSFDRRFDRADAYEPHSLLHTPFAQSLDGCCQENLNKSVYDLDVDLFNLGIDWEDVFKREEWSTVRHGGYCMPAQQTTFLEREATKKKRAKERKAANEEGEEVVDEADLWRYNSSEGKAIFAWDAVQYTDATLREEAKNPTEDSHITGLNELMRCAPWVDLVHACNFPVAHTLNHGVGDGLLDCVFEKTATKRVKGVWLSPAKGRQLDERLAAVVTVHDVSRPPKRVSEARGFWTYDDTAWMYALYLPLVGLQDILEEDWMQELFWHMTVLFRHCWFLCHPGEFYHNSWERAVHSAKEVGVLLEKHELYSELTSNLHTVVCHMVESEAYVGALRVGREVWIEIALGILKLVELLADGFGDGIQGVVRKAGQSTKSSSSCSYTMEKAAGAPRLSPLQSGGTSWEGSMPRCGGGSTG